MKIKIPEVLNSKNVTRKLLVICFTVWAPDGATGVTAVSSVFIVSSVSFTLLWIAEFGILD